MKKLSILIIFFIFGCVTHNHNHANSKELQGGFNKIEKGLNELSKKFDKPKQKKVLCALQFGRISYKLFNPVPIEDCKMMQNMLFDIKKAVINDYNKNFRPYKNKNFKKI